MDKYVWIFIFLDRKFEKMKNDVYEKNQKTPNNNGIIDKKYTNMS